MKIRLVIVFVMALGLGIVPTWASNEPITAEVVYPTVYLRALPTTEGEIVGHVEQGGILTVNNRYNSGKWIQVTDSKTGTIGWINTKLVVFSSENWTQQVPTVDYREMRRMFAQQTNPPSYVAEVCTQGASMLLNVHAAPYLLSDPAYASEIVGQVAEETMVTVLGRARINNQPSVFVYIHDPATGISGWIDSHFLEDLGYLAGMYDELPLMYNA